MEIFIFWLIGWVILSIGYYIWKIYTDDKVTKKLHAWRAFWIGMLSWFAIYFIIAFFIVGGIIVLNEWIEEKLNR